MRKLLKKQEVFDAISGTKRPARVPVQYTSWFNPFVFQGTDFIRAIWSRLSYPDDIAICGWHCLRNYLYATDEKYGGTLRCIFLGFLTGGAPTPIKKYRTEQGESVDNQILVEDMTKIDDFIAKLPDPNKVFLLFPGHSKRYKVSWNFSCLFENHWTVRGMENALMDFYIYPEETHRLYRAFTDHAKVLIKRSHDELHADAMFMCDDIGTQTGPFFSLEIFNEFFKPYYKELIDYAHSLGMHFWFHTCGDVTMFLDSFVEMGLDVLHPIQKSAMNQPEVFEKYKDKITFLYGFDVQHVIPEGTPDEVEAEVKRTMDMFGQARGRLVYTSGNVITGDCPIESLERLMKVSHTYNPYIKMGENV